MIYPQNLSGSFEQIASEAELEGKYDIALKGYTNSLLSLTDLIKYPNKNIPNAKRGEEWIKSLNSYFSWIIYPVSHNNMEIYKSVEGIVRCTSFVENNNFITSKKPKVISKIDFIKEWKHAFVYEGDENIEQHNNLINQSLNSHISILRIRSMNGYTYFGKLFSLKTGKRVDFTLYPSSEISLLLIPGDYFLICSSEVNFTEGLKGRSWQSPENIIPIIIKEKNNTLYQITLKTSVSRKS